MLIFKFDWEKTNVNDNLTKLNFRFERSKLLRTKLNLKIDEIEWRGDENGRENLCINKW